MSDHLTDDERSERSRKFINRELSWLRFARRVLSLAARDDLPLLERVKFAGIVGMLHDEFFMKRMSGLKREIAKGVTKLSIDGRTPQEEFAACREELLRQTDELGEAMQSILRELARERIPILTYDDLDDAERDGLRDYFRSNVQPILTPLAVDSEHPFPFISNLGLNLAVKISNRKQRSERFVRIEVPGNRPRWVPVSRRGVVPLEQVIAANLDLVYPGSKPGTVHVFRVTRGAEGNVDHTDLSDDAALREPGSILRQVGRELKARRFAGVVRVQVDESMPKKLAKWLAKQLNVGSADVYRTPTMLALADLQNLPTAKRDDLRFPSYEPATHPRLQNLTADEPEAIFEEIAGGDILLHHPYHSFDTSVLRFLESAAADPAVLAIKLTIYRTSARSPIVAALTEAVRRGKQVAVLVEVTARFDEAPNIEWGRYLENEGVHVSYGVERLKTHVKLALVVREEPGGIRRYAHVGTGNYHTGTARIYEDLGLLTCNASICDDVAAVFNSLTGAIPYPELGKLIVAPIAMRDRFNAMIRREAEHARAGRPSGIVAKMNQLQDSGIIRELYDASAAGVPIRLNVRGLCCLRPGVPGLSENIEVFGLVGRYLEHSRVFRFENGGNPEHFIGSSDWMKRNLNNRVETVAPVEDPEAKAELDRILAVYDEDNCSVWDCGPDGSYTRRTPGEGEARRSAQERFIALARERGGETGAAVPSPQVRSRRPRRVLRTQPGLGTLLFIF